MYIVQVKPLNSEVFSMLCAYEDKSDAEFKCKHWQELLGEDRVRIVEKDVASMFVLMRHDEGCSLPIKIYASEEEAAREMQLLQKEHGAQYSIVETELA